MIGRHLPLGVNGRTEGLNDVARHGGANVEAQGRGALHVLVTNDLLLPTIEA